MTRSHSVVHLAFAAPDAAATARALLAAEDLRADIVPAPGSAAPPRCLRLTSPLPEDALRDHVRARLEGHGLRYWWTGSSGL